MSRRSRPTRLGPAFLDFTKELKTMVPSSKSTPEFLDELTFTMREARIDDQLKTLLVRRYRRR